MNQEVEQSKGLTHLTLVLNTGKETAKEKEGKKKTSFVIFGYSGIRFQPREPESVANNRVLSQTRTRSPPPLLYSLI